MVTVVEHPLVQHLISMLRDQRTRPEQFRDYANRISGLLLYEATRDLALHAEPIDTPMEPTRGHLLSEGLALVPVLRAGLAMLQAGLDLFPDVAVGYIGLERDHDSAIAHSYYCKLPPLSGRTTVCLDPMLATGGSAAQALTILKESGAQNLRMVSVIAAPEGIACLQAAHPDVPFFTAALDRELNPSKYIMPGLGDFGDRLYGTGIV